MFEQLTQLVQQFGQEHVVENTAIPNEHNEGVMKEASSTILSSLQNVAGQSGGHEMLAGLFQGNNAGDSSNPIVSMITNALVTNLGSKFGINGGAATGMAASLIPKVLGSLIGGAKDPNNSGIQMNDVLGAITGGGESSGGLMDMITKYGGMVGLDKNHDGKVDISDAISAVTGSGAAAPAADGGGGFLGGLLGKILGK